MSKNHQKLKSLSGTKMFIQGIEREQLNLFEEKLDDIISKDHPARFIDAYVEKLDLEKLGFIEKGNNPGRGRPAYAAGVLLKIYIYGYLNKIRSSRKLESECNRNVELMWLTGRLAPDFKTIANFRNENSKSLKKIFSEFLKLCHKLELLSLKCVAVDGTKLRAQNSLDNIYKREEIEKIEQRIQEKIEKYLEELESNDNAEESDYDFLTRNLPEKIRNLKKKQDKIDIIKKIFEENSELDIYFAGDPDAGYQKDNNRINTGYNCQSVVDEKNNLIISSEITNESNDLHQLNRMKDTLAELREDFEYEGKTVLVADAGYFQEEEILKADKDESYEVFVPHPRDSEKSKIRKKKNPDTIPAEGYTIDNFKYDISSDTFECPAGKKLVRYGKPYIDKSSGTVKYEYKCKDCSGCDKRDFCTRNKKGRKIKVTENMKEISEFRERCQTDTGKKVISKRKEMVEHPFGTIKRNWGYRYFMQKGTDKVSAEFSFIAFIYNFKRVLNLMPFSVLMETLEEI